MENLQKIYKCLINLKMLLNNTSNQINGSTKNSQRRVVEQIFEEPYNTKESSVLIEMDGRNLFRLTLNILVTIMLNRNGRQ